MEHLGTVERVERFGTNQWNKNWNGTGLARSSLTAQLVPVHRIPAPETGYGVQVRRYRGLRRIYQDEYQYLKYLYQY